jgi:LmbE family N-acetylglucosaminyl deacetylase
MRKYSQGGHESNAISKVVSDPMRHVILPWNTTSSPKILCVGAHADDIEIGCGGTVLQLAERHPGCIFYWIVFSAEGVRAEEARRSAASFAKSATIKGPEIKGFQDGFMPYAGSQVKSAFEELKAISPDLIFTHNREDAHQDHRLLADLTWNTFRDHLILEYEIPKYDGDLGRPNLFVPLEKVSTRDKVRYIMESFVSQHQKRWFDPETFFSIMRLRGMECNSPSGYAEAFYSSKLTLEFGNRQ